MIVTITAHRRTAELRRAMTALSRIAESSPIFVSVDGGEAESLDVYRAANAFTDQHCWGQPIARRLNDPPFGLWTTNNNALSTYDWAFAVEPREDSIVAIEDDCVLSPDALELCQWFVWHGQMFGDYTFLSLANCNKPEVCVGRERDLVIADCIESPWAWCFTRRMWEERIRPQWNWRTEPPVGWDWSLSSSMEKNGWKALCPVLPRAKNIGREMGANGGREIFDQTLALAAFSDGSWGNDFRVVE